MCIKQNSDDRRQPITPGDLSFIATPATVPMFNLGDGLLPTNLDGSTLQPAGMPSFYIGSQDNSGPYGAPSDALDIWKFTVNFATPPSSILQTLYR